MSAAEKCSTCGGAGVVDMDRAPYQAGCPACGGDGLVCTCCAISPVFCDRTRADRSDYIDRSTL